MITPQSAADAFRQQAGWCRDFGSPFYADLIDAAAADVAAEGPVWRVCGARELSAFPLRLMGSVHRLVLDGRAPRLAQHYPSTGGDGDVSAATAALIDTISEHEGALSALVENPVQTNEIARSAVLLGGFLTIAVENGTPLHLLELGASAGLNLRWDSYRYELNGETWGDESSPVQLAPPFEGTPRLAVDAVEITGRSGCDIEPVDPSTAEGALTLLSYVWADRVDRMERTRAAIEIARAQPARVEKGDALEWLRMQLIRRPADATTVVFHSIVLPYLGDKVGELASLIAEAGGKANAGLAWLRYEPGPQATELRLTTWPGGEERLLAEGGPHAQWVKWLAV